MAYNPLDRRNIKPLKATTRAVQRNVTCRKYPASGALVYSIEGLIEILFTVDYKNEELVLVATDANTQEPVKNLSEYLPFLEVTEEVILTSIGYIFEPYANIDQDEDNLRREHALLVRKSLDALVYTHSFKVKEDEHSLDNFFGGIPMEEFLCFPKDGLIMNVQEDFFYIFIPYRVRTKMASKIFFKTYVSPINHIRLLPIDTYDVIDRIDEVDLLSSLKAEYRKALQVPPTEKEDERIAFFDKYLPAGRYMGITTLSEELEVELYGDSEDEESSDDIVEW